MQLLWTNFLHKRSRSNNPCQEHICSVCKPKKKYQCMYHFPPQLWNKLFLSTKWYSLELSLVVASKCSLLEVRPFDIVTIAMMTWPLILLSCLYQSKHFSLVKSIFKSRCDLLPSLYKCFRNLFPMIWKLLLYTKFAYHHFLHFFHNRRNFRV